MEKLTGHDKIFYDDQRTTWKCRISEEIDQEYEESRLLAMEEAIEKAIEDEETESFIFYPSFDEMVPTSSRQPTQSKKTCVDETTQITTIDNPMPEIRKIKKSTEEIKDAIATVSSRAGVSVPKARVAVKAVSEKLYGHVYLLEPPGTTSNEKETATQEEPPSKRPYSEEDYVKYKDVLPSAKVVSLYRHKKAMYQEILAARSLIEKASTTKVTLHCDTTSRSRIDGEWPSLILNFNDDKKENCQFLPLRPLYFAHEDRDQIIKLVVETFKRLSAALNGIYTPKILWERVET